jgi:hypothetical protein
VAGFSGGGRVTVQDCHFDESRERAIRAEGGARLEDERTEYGGIGHTEMTFEDIGWRNSRSPTYRPVEGAEADEEESDHELPRTIKMLLVFAGFSITIIGEFLANQLVRRLRWDRKTARDLV